MEEVRINYRDLNQSTIRQHFCYDYFDLIQFKYIFQTFIIDKDFLRELIGKLNHCELLEIHSDILTSAKIIRVLSDEYLANAVTFLTTCCVLYWREQYSYYNAIQKFEYRLQYQRTDEYKNLHEGK